MRTREQETDDIKLSEVKRKILEAEAKLSRLERDIKVFEEDFDLLCSKRNKAIKELQEANIPLSNARRELTVIIGQKVSELKEIEKARRELMVERDDLEQKKKVVVEDYKKLAGIQSDIAEQRNESKRSAEKARASEDSSVKALENLRKKEEEIISLIEKSEERIKQANETERLLDRKEDGVKILQLKFEENKSIVNQQFDDLRISRNKIEEEKKELTKSRGVLEIIQMDALKDRKKFEASKLDYEVEIEKIKVDYAFKSRNLQTSALRILKIINDNQISGVSGEIIEILNRT